MMRRERAAVSDNGTVIIITTCGASRCFWQTQVSGACMQVAQRATSQATCKSRKIRNEHEST